MKPGSEDSFELPIVDFANIPITLISNDYHYRFVNSCYCQFQGKRKDDFIGQSIEQVWGKEAFETAIKAKLDRCFQGEIVHDEAWMTFPTLGLRYCEVVYSPYFDANNAMNHAVVVTYDITERRQIEEAQVFVQRDLALSLAATLELEDALFMCLETAVKACGADCGAVHVRNKETDDLEMAVQIGLKKKFADRFSEIKTGSNIWSMSTEIIKSSFLLSADLEEPARSYLLDAGINSLATIPVSHDDRLIAVMNLGFYSTPVLTKGWPTLELIASQLGNIMVRIETQLELKKDIEKRKKAEEALQAKSRSLEEINTALKVLLNQREADKSELEESVLANVRRLVLPYAKRLRESRLNELQYSLLDIVEENLNGIISPFLKRVRVFNFTPRELEVVTLIKEGKTTKDITAILGVSTSAIDVHRYNIRKKLGINNQEKNLRSHLLSLE